MEMTREYLNEQLVSIIAPAGYGKTEEIANAVNFCSGRQLVLTHTRAGVAALRARMKKRGISNEQYEVDTIAAFSLKWCKAYPATARVKIPNNNSEINYVAIYNGARNIFEMNWAREVLRQTYSGIFVDEYQDCTQSQHSIIMCLKGLIPIRLFGDPLQGIFYWVNEDKIINFNDFSIKTITPLTYPWRWEETNKRLGILLDDLRKKLLVTIEGNSVTINISNVESCMSIVSSSIWNHGRYAYNIRGYDSIVYLASFEKKQQSFSQHNGGYFQCDERKDLEEAERIIKRIQAEKNEKRALVLLELLAYIINGINAELGSYLRNLRNGNTDFSRIRKHKELGDLIIDVCNDNSMKPVLNVLRWFNTSNEFNIFRGKLFYKIGKIVAYMTDENVTLHEAVEFLSGQRYFTEKNFGFSRLSSRTVLTKGLEFDCVIIDARDAMDARDFYVAMTRAKKYIYIISDEKQLTFKGITY